MSFPYQHLLSISNRNWREKKSENFFEKIFKKFAGKKTFSVSKKKLNVSYLLRGNPLALTQLVKV